MRFNFTTKDIGHTDLVDDALGDVRYAIRTNIDGKMKTFVGRFYLHTILSDKIGWKQLDVKEWMHAEGKGSAFTSQSGKKYVWPLQQHGDAALHDEDGKQAACLYERSSLLFGGEKREGAFLEVNGELNDTLDDIIISCLYFKLRGQHAGFFAI